MNTDHVTLYAKRARHLSVVPFVAPPQESRGQTLAGERSWGELPIKYMGDESEDVKPVAVITKSPDEEADVPPHRELLKGMLIGFSMAAVGAIVGLAVGSALYFKFYQ